MHDVMNEHVAFCAEVVLAARTPISSERAHAFARRTGHWRVLERTCAGVAHPARIQDIVQCRTKCVINSLVHRHLSNQRTRYSHSLVRLDGEQMVVTPREMRRAHDHEPTYIAVRRDVAHFRYAPRAQKAFALELRMTHT